jgi:hypothetical protein
MFAQAYSFPNLATVRSIQDRTLSRLVMSAVHVQYRYFASGISLSISLLALERFSADVAHIDTTAPRTVLGQKLVSTTHEPSQST